VLFMRCYCVVLVVFWNAAVVVCWCAGCVAGIAWCVVAGVGVVLMWVCGDVRCCAVVVVVGVLWLCLCGCAV